PRSSINPMIRARPVSTHGLFRSSATESQVPTEMNQIMFRRSLSAILSLAILLAAAPSVFAAKQLAGRWTLTVTIPDGPNSSNTGTLTLTLDASPRGESLHGRLTVADESGRTVGGAWRQVGKNASIAFELPCPGDVPCGSIILLGKIKSSGTRIKNGAVIVMWDTPNDHNPALYDTSNGSFSGQRLE